LPAWVKDAQRRFAQRPTPRISANWPALPAIGELRIMEPIEGGPAEPRLVCVLGVDQDEGMAEVALVSNETELATDRDLEVPTGASGLPFDLLVQADRVARVWLIRLGGAAGRLADDMIEDLLRAAAGEGSVSVESALPVQGPADPRSVFKEQEQAALDALVGESNEHFGRHERAPVVVDPAVFAREGNESGESFLGRMVAVAERFVGSETSVVPERAFEEMVAATGCASASELESIGCDTVRALSPMLEAALREPPSTGDEVIRFDPGRTARGSGVADELLALIPSLAEGGARSVRLLTVQDAWSDGMPAATAMAAATMKGSGPLQIVRFDMEGAW
jgi:hypothetical protein